MRKQTTSDRLGPPGVCGVYGLYDPREPWRIRYVGASKNVWRRVYSHLSRGGNPHTPVRRWTEDLRTQGVTGRGVVLAELPFGADPRRAEKDLILTYRLAGMADLNTHWGENEAPSRTEIIQTLKSEIYWLKTQLACARAALRGEPCSLLTVDVDDDDV